MADQRPPLDLKNASTGDPLQQEAAPANGMVEAIDRRTIRQAIITHLLSEVATEILDSGKSLDGSLRDAYYLDQLPKLRAFVTNPEREFNRVRDKLFVARPFGSINLVVFMNAMAIGTSEKETDPEEVAKRVVIRVGLSGGYRNRKFAGCK